MKKWLAVVVLGLAVVAGSIGWRHAVQDVNYAGAHTLIATGSDPVPPSPGN